MKFRRRLALLESLATAGEAHMRALRVACEDDDDPPNVVRDAEKTGPRSPFDETRKVKHLQRIYEEAHTATDRERVMKIAKRYAALGYITDRDVDTIKDPR